MAKFIQIAVAGPDESGQDIVYALDDEGRVYSYSGPNSVLPRPIWFPITREIHVPAKSTVEKRR